MSTINLYFEKDNGVTVTQTHELKTIHFDVLPSGIAIATFNTPKNALSSTQQWEIFAILEEIHRNSQRIRVVIWTGHGRIFNSGYPFNADTPSTIPEHIRHQMTQRGRGVIEGDFVLSAMTCAFWDLPIPSICAVNGLAIGGAANMVFANYHDFVICSNDAKFMFPFAALGITPELGSSLILPHLIGMLKTKELMYLGDWFTAQDAYKWGLISAVVAPDQLIFESMKVAERLLFKHPQAIRLSKHILHRHLRAQLTDALQAENEIIMESLQLTGGPVRVKKWTDEQKAKSCKL
jgi:enoyl-CoA hydratase/carnithine racemase